jgi:hypothetical protein
MKYTIKQILAFSAKAYDVELNKAGGRSGYLFKDNVKITEFKRPWLRANASMLISAQTLCISAYNSGALIVNGFDPITALVGFTSLSLAAVSALIFREERRIHRDQMEDLKDYARGHEPEGVWNLDYPADNGVRANLIRSLLGTRLIARKMIATTAIPMDNDVVDSRVAHLIREISSCKDDDIHPYLVEESKSFARQVFQDFNFYAPLITFQDEVQKEFATLRSVA